MSEEKKILVIQTAFPGDAILTLPLIQELKKKKPEYLIDVLCIPSTVEILRLLLMLILQFHLIKKASKNPSLLSSDL